MKNPLVSIIIPVFNSESFLCKCIDSVINQTYRNLEILLILGHSSDNSEKICNEYAMKDRRISVYFEDRSGPSGARNTGLKYFKGDYVSFVDADDYINPMMIERFIDSFLNLSPSLVMGNFSKLESDGSTTPQMVTFRPDDNAFEEPCLHIIPSGIDDYIFHFYKHPSNHMISYCWGRLYNSSIIREFGITFIDNMQLFEDYVFNLEYLKYSSSLFFINYPFYTYRMHSSHISASMAILNGDSLIHDMNVFQSKTNEFFEVRSQNPFYLSDIHKKIGHTLIHYCIIFFVRSCRLIDLHNACLIYKEIKKVILAPITRNSLPFYTPSKGNSRVIPLLIRLKLTMCIICVCYYKGNKRYGKLRRVKS